MAATPYDALAPPTDPTNSRICRIEGVGSTHAYALIGIFTRNDKGHNDRATQYLHLRPGMPNSEYLWLSAVSRSALRKVRSHQFCTSYGCLTSRRIQQGPCTWPAGQPGAVVAPVPIYHFSKCSATLCYEIELMPYQPARGHLDVPPSEVDR
jgi:hypothetical protein